MIKSKVKNQEENQIPSKNANFCGQKQSVVCMPQSSLLY